MAMVPDVTTGYIDPFYSEKTIAFTCDVVDPITYESYTRDPRYIAKKAEKYLNSIENKFCKTSLFHSYSKEIVFIEDYIR